MQAAVRNEDMWTKSWFLTIISGADATAIKLQKIGGVIHLKLTHLGKLFTTINISDNNSNRNLKIHSF